MLRLLAPCLLAAAVAILGPPAPVAACSIKYIPWQLQAVWPSRDVLAPLNTHVYVYIPERFGALIVAPPDPVPVPDLSGRVTAPLEEPGARLAAALSLREVASDGSLGSEVPTRWSARRDHSGLSVELVPRGPLRPQSEYAVLLAMWGGTGRLGRGIRTGSQRDERAPVWQGISRAAFVPATGRLDFGSCPQLFEHGPQAELSIHEAADDSPVRYAVWLAKPWEALRYEDTRPFYLTPRRGVLVISELPENAPRLRIGVRAVDAAGNMSPPYEVSLELPYSPLPWP